MRSREMLRQHGHVRAAAVAAAMSVAAAAMSGCSGADAMDTKAGTRTDPIVLRVATDDPDDRPTAVMIQTFARQVADRSGGSLTVQPDYRADIGGTSGWDQQVARLVTSGQVEMGLIPTRAWDTEGVTSLRALNAPFLVTNDALLNDVVSSDVADGLMAGLSTAGVTGLALFPEGLRHPFALGAPLLGPDSYSGAVLRSPTSATTHAVLEALGARITDDPANATTQAGLESSYSRASFDTPTATATGNVTFFPKVDALVINNDVLGRLSAEQQKTLREAAVAARDATIASAVDDAVLAEQYCAHGGAVVVASADQLSALERATAGVYYVLEQDPATADLITRIRTMKAARPDGPSAKACGNATPAPSTAPAITEPTDQSLLNGVYRFEVTDAQIAATGITDPGQLDENHGVYTWTLKDGKYCWTAKADNVQRNPKECLTYTLDGDQIVIWESGGREIYTWKRAKNGDLTLAPVKTIDGMSVPLMTANVWVRVRDAT